MTKKKHYYQDYDSYEDYVRREHPEDAGMLRAKPRRVKRRVYDENEPQEMYEEEDDEYIQDAEEEKPARKRGKKKKKGFLQRLLPILIVLAVIIGVPVYLIASRFDNIHSVSDPGSFSRSLKSEMSEEAATSSVMKDYTNIALFGVDSREEELLSGNNRSDIIIILSMHKRTGKCKLLSVYRDTYLDIGGDSFRKANAAYAFGGPEQAVNMLNRNFDLNISDFVTIGFGGLADLIDAVGGVEIDVAEDEIHGINDYQSTMAQELSRDYRTVDAPGLQTLDGLQAVAYCRIRYTAGDDYRRTERQREVLQQTFRNAKRMTPAKLSAITTQVFRQTATSLTVSEALALSSKLLMLDIVDTAGCPEASLRTSGTVNQESCIIPKSLEDNVRWLHEFLFEENDYRVSERVKKISARIDADTAGIG